MAGERVIAICQSGGEFEADEDGLLSYKGGDAHAMEIDDQMQYEDFKAEVAEMFNCTLTTMSIKYFLPGNRKTLITISNEKDLKRMIQFHCASDSAEIYVMTEEPLALDLSTMPGSRSSRTTLSESGVPIDAPPEDIVDDPDQHVLLLDDDAFDIVGDTSTTADPPQIEMSSGLPISVSFAVNYNEKNAKAAQQWQNSITGVGQRFNTVHEFRETLRKYAIANQFAFKYKKNDSHRVTVKCKAEGCQWRIHASRLSTTQLICIKKMNPTHTCEGAVVTTGYQATRSWVASIVKEKLRVFPNYKPKDIVNDIKEEYGIQLNYFQAWRGKEIAKEQLQGSYKEAYSQLPIFCEKVMESNVGSYATFTTKEDSSFHRLFVSFHASLFGFEQGCRPLLFLDGIFLKSKYQGNLLVATAADGNDGAFPVAFAVVDTESEDNWHWFLLQLKAALSMCRGITFVADREKGLQKSIAEVFQNEDVYHGFCVRYLAEQLIRDLTGHFSHEVKRLLVDDLYKAAYALKPDSFHTCVERIKSISVEAYNWVFQSDPSHWANAFFPGARYNHIASNFGELFYNWVADAHELPITQMVDAIRGKIMDLIYTRRTESNQWMTRLTPFMEEKLEKESLKVHSVQVMMSTTTRNKFEVHGGESIECVDIDQCDCSCREWQISGLPCCHAIAVIGCLGRDPYNFCARYFTADSYRLTYSESVHPIPCLDSSSSNHTHRKDVSQTVATVTPPPTRRPPGRPTTKNVGLSERRQVQCSRCKGIGHNKSSCKEGVIES
ncbi:unnamed protein product [Cuscuta epithymum]|uniref:SWIM-type domain-containing protein n=2 Tax=Cuscuta epithymum TaxID=186058 RepID=A0AAV0CH28_9ASTE|nr:unnamed protein product [Cuscuta epithymum]CAH9141075.1 unnamed protein product [Cuscuta epithymum]